MITGLLAMLALTIAPACAFSSAPFGFEAAAAARHEGAPAPLHCGKDSQGKSASGSVLCGFFCGFFLIPAATEVGAEFEAPKYASAIAQLYGDRLRPPAPPPRR